MSESDPQQIFNRIAEGNQDAFLELYTRWNAALFRFAWQMTGSRSVAEDVIQEVFLQIIRKRLRFDPAKGSLSAFLYGIARNLALKTVEKNRRLSGFLETMERQTSPSNSSDPLRELTREESASDLRRCILSLPPQYREVVVLCDLHEMSYQEAADVTGSAVGTVRSRLHRGRELLLQKMRPTKQEENRGGTTYEIPAL